MKKQLLLTACILMSTMAVNAQATVTPVTISSGYNMDVIAENTTTDADGYLVSVTKIPGSNDLQGIDGGGFVYYTADANASGAMCSADGKFSTDAKDISYQVNVASNNALVLKGNKVPGADVSGTLTFATVQKAGSIYVCGTSTDGDTPLKVTVNYADGSTVDDNITFYNWDSSQYSSSAVLKGLGRMASKHCWAGDAGSTQGGNNFMIFQSSIDTDKTKDIKSVTIAKANPDATTCCAIFAVSVSNLTKEETLGIGGVKATQEKIAASYYNVGGSQISELQKGVNIVKYSDGTTRKVVVR